MTLNSEFDKSIIDIKFDFHSDSKGGDPDIYSPTLKRYHKILWSKELPNGKKINLSKKTGAYLHCEIDNVDFFLGSDAITNSYRHHKSKSWIIKEIQNDAEELYKAGATIGAYILFPNKKINGFQTINQVRGINRFIDDRFDLTLQCIKNFYQKIESPLYPTLSIYNEFFNLFQTFENYIDFFLLNDLVDDKYNVKFFMPFSNFQTKPILTKIDDYLNYKQEALNFINLRNKRIEKFVKS
ncbi:DUF6994 family protein [Chryseobacterium sp.]|uniref:DUF6994 family protein n=1 Tax=Chryseobacterium sp. TaxID=1871047 RepID=UPI002FC9CAE2